MILNCPAQPWQRHCGSVACLHHARITEHNDACEFRIRPLRRGTRRNKQKRSTVWRQFYLKFWEMAAVGDGRRRGSSCRMARETLQAGRRRGHTPSWLPTHARIAAERDGIERHEAMPDACQRVERNRRTAWPPTCSWDAPDAPDVNRSSLVH